MLFGTSFLFAENLRNLSYPEMDWGGGLEIPVPMFGRWTIGDPQLLPWGLLHSGWPLFWSEGLIQIIMPAIDSNSNVILVN